MNLIFMYMLTYRNMFTAMYYVLTKTAIKKNSLQQIWGIILLQH